MALRGGRLLDLGGRRRHIAGLRLNLSDPVRLIAMARLSLKQFLTNFYIRAPWRRGTLVGTDSFGNRYFSSPVNGKWGRDSRWVLYAAEDEASLVPPEWHGWLHHSANEPPTEQSRTVRPWQKPHLPNATGTDAAYRPPGHTLEGSHRARATGDYQAWTPPE
jgi:NADH:ubiquinone oxidoreductase subunit